MRISTIFYILKQGMKNIYRNKMFSLASMATMAACIFLFSLFFAIVTNFQHIVKKAEESVAVTVFFDEEISEERILEIGDIIEKRAEVSECHYTSADDAWNKYQEEYFGDDPGLASAFDEDNPLLNSDHYEIYMNDVSMQSALVTYLESIDGVRKVNHSKKVADLLTDFNILMGYISIAVIIILLAVAIFLISNTVTIGITVRKEEIGIMKLIGATDYFVRSPFIIEGAIIGLVGSALPLVVIYFLYNRIISFINDKFGILPLEFISADAVFRVLIPTALVMGLGVGLIGSLTTIRKHLKV